MNSNDFFDLDHWLTTTPYDALPDPVRAQVDEEMGEVIYQAIRMGLPAVPMVPQELEHRLLATYCGQYKVRAVWWQRSVPLWLVLLIALAGLGVGALLWQWNAPTAPAAPPVAPERYVQQELLPADTSSSIKIATGAYPPSSDPVIVRQASPSSKVRPALLRQQVPSVSPEQSAPATESGRSLPRSTVIYPLSSLPASAVAAPAVVDSGLSASLVRVW